MLTVSVYFRIKNHPIFNGEDGYISQSVDFVTSNNPKGLQEILKILDMLKDSLTESLKAKKSDIEVISRIEYEESTEEE